VRILQSIDDSASTTCPSCSPRPALRIPRSLQAVLSAAGARGPGADSPSNGPAAKAQRPGGRPGPGRAGTGSPAGPANPTPTSPRRSGGAGGGTQPSGGGGQPSPTTVPSQPLPSQPLPSEPLPSQPLPTLPSPSLPLPSKPLPSLPLQVPSAPAAGGGHGSHGIPVPLPPVQLP
jgi:translation initiation factor IF-2